MTLEDLLYASMDFYMNWIAGLWITLGSKCPFWLRPVFLILSLVWIPTIFILFLPLLALWAVTAMIHGLWEILNEV